MLTSLFFWLPPCGCIDGVTTLHELRLCEFERLAAAYRKEAIGIYTTHSAYIYDPSIDIMNGL
jgi:hypothetical protein